MKTHILTLAVIMSSLLCTSVHAQNCKADTFPLRSQVNSKSRGIDANKIFYSKPEEPERIPSDIPQTRGKASCKISVLNRSAHDISVYVDSAYVGYVPAGQRGKLIPKNGNYSIVHFWTFNGDRKWYHEGSCPCEKVYILDK